ncbi:sensor histidine kinase [Micromonospora sp. NBC_01638]|uniref:sensor histidine kinase n=1 Tax=Micromonospora sp. NBC_01638 TaxID=2975982 RepID=UPI00386CCEA6|nr:ATP-binding protein [Micromonospora sp. NBC_01638]
MSFRLRVLLLVALVAVSATSATTWLSLREVSQQIDESATIDRAQLDQVSAALLDYGSRHGTWEGVADLADDLSHKLGQRIHLQSEAGVVIVDTDTMAGRTARKVGNVTALIDPRPKLSPTRLTADTTTHSIRSYRAGATFAACLARVNLGVTMQPDSHGVPTFNLDPADRDKTLGDRPGSMVAAECRQQADRAGASTDLDQARVAVCRTEAVGSSEGCLAQAFTDQISAVAPVPVRVYLGAGGYATPVLAIGPLLAAAAVVMTIALVGTALLSRRVLRPIRTLTAASHRLGDGDLSNRVPVRGNDELAGLARSFNQMADSLRSAEERQRRLIADVAHELRTPLANLRGYLEALQDGVIAPGPELFASLHDEAVLQQRIVDDLQDLALAEAGQLAYHRVPVDVAELLETCRTAHRSRAEADRVALAVRAEPATVHGDPDRLRQLIGNLITNALRATPAGGRITLEAHHAQGTVVVRIVDTGCGIASDALPHIFERFWRGDPARGRHTGGSGLGLSIARQIITDHGGSIEVASQVGAGCTFTITLPAISAT